MTQKKLNLTAKAVLLCLCILATQVNTKQVFAQINKSKVSNKLLNLVKTKSDNLKSASKAKTNVLQDEFENNKLLHITEGQYVIIEAISKGNNKTLINDLKKLGLKNINSFGGLVSGHLPISSINKLKNINSLQFISPAIPSRNSIGSATSHGDDMQYSKDLRAKYGVEGYGIKIGTISDSYNYYKGAKDGVLSGDLPGKENPDGYTTEVKVLKEGIDSNLKDEGRGMIEVIHDIAPAAEKTFHTSKGGQAALAQAIINLAKDGADIINDDVSYWAEPFFQDGVIAQAIDSVTKTYGIDFISAAGNLGNSSYESEFRPSGDTTTIYNLNGDNLGKYIMHDFDESEKIDIYQNITIGKNGNLILSFQWDEPFASVCEGCPGSASDLDIFVLTEEDPSTVAIAENNNNFGADALEIVSCRNKSDKPIQRYIAIGKRITPEEENPNPSKIKYISLSNGISFNEHKTNSPTIYGHQNSTNCITVAAFDGFLYGTPPTYIKIFEFYSSVGGIKILFDKKGNRIQNPQVRKKPNFTAPTGGNTSFFGESDTDGDGFPNFSGTSASAPHAAGVFALLKQIQGTKESWKSLDKIVSETSKDIKDKYDKGFNEGHDLRTGYGEINAMKAAEELIKIIGVKPLILEEMCSANPELVRTWKVSNLNTFNVQCNYNILNSTQSEDFIAKPGETIINTETDEFNQMELRYIGPYGDIRYTSDYSHGEKCNEESLKSAINEKSNDTFTITNIYPLPTNNDLNIEFVSSNENQIALKVIDVSGHIISLDTYNTFVGNNKITKDLTKVSSGFYIIQIESKSGEILTIKKLLKK